MQRESSIKSIVAGRLWGAGRSVALAVGFGVGLGSVAFAQPNVSPPVDPQASTTPNASTPPGGVARGVVPPPAVDPGMVTPPPINAITPTMPVIKPPGTAR